MVDTLIKIAITLGILFLLAFPLLPLKNKKGKYVTLFGLRFEDPENEKNLWFAGLTVGLFLAIAFLADLIDEAATLITKIPLLGKLIVAFTSGLSSKTDFVLFTIRVFLVNAAILYGVAIVKALFKKLIHDLILHKGGKSTSESTDEKEKESEKEKNSEENEEDTADSDEDSTDDNKKKKKDKKHFRIPHFVHTALEYEDDETADDNEEGNGKSGGIKVFKPTFFQRFLYDLDEEPRPKKWVVRVQRVLQKFVFATEIVYFLFFGALLLMLFFKMPEGFCRFFIDFLKIENWYVYPFISLIFLQEICNTFNYPVVPEEEEEKKKEEKKQEQELEIRLRELMAELQRRFDAEHEMRFYPDTKQVETTPYVCTNVQYRAALSYIEKQMKANSGRVVPSYMECLDALFNGNHVYFGASFYSELGEYFIAYVYTRLLAGSRAVFVTSNRKVLESLRIYINERLKKLTGTSDACTWRVFTSDERVDQADVLITSPEDFSDTDLVHQFPDFFEEVSDAVFIDADRIVALDSYRCPIIAKSLQRATKDRVRFTFLSRDFYGGFSTATLPKFFCVSRVSNFSGVKDKENVAYTLWNLESKKQRIYSANGHTLTSIEAIVAGEALKRNVDGIRIISRAPIEHADRDNLSAHGVEVNEFHKVLPEVNYMVYMDDHCHLAAAMYAASRFRGKQKSVVHILNRPYLLREFFMSKAVLEDYINYFTIIQPRVSEHVDNYTLSLLRIYCDTCGEYGLPVEEFVSRMKSVILKEKKRQTPLPCPGCVKLAEELEKNDYQLNTLAAFLVAALCDDSDLDPDKSTSFRSRDYYLIMDKIEQDGTVTKCIGFKRVNEIYTHLLKDNKRVELRLHDMHIGWLDTFPSRVNVEYMVGQSIVYDNVEYEIEQISDNFDVIHLRSENVTFRNCLDTFFLRRYTIHSMEQIGDVGVWDLSRANLKEIRVALCKTAFVGETYGFYNLMSNHQTLDFYHGVEGNFCLDAPAIEKNKRDLKEGRVLQITFVSQNKCTDGMRLLIAAVFNEMIRTIFPETYHCVAFCPILEQPIVVNNPAEQTPEERIRSLYPYVCSAPEALTTMAENEMKFLLINDCLEDVGILDWFSGLSVRYVYEFIATMYSYMHWLKLHSAIPQYIFFGGEKLADCFDLDGCCELFNDFNMVLSDEGIKDYETAGEDDFEEETVRCSFCHRIMKSGRYQLFDKHRYVCADCFETVYKQEQLDKINDEIRAYLKKQYPNEIFGSCSVSFDPPYELTEECALSEYYYRLDTENRALFLEKDLPVRNARVSELHGIIGMWQEDNNCVTTYALAQLYYEEIKYLRLRGDLDIADWIYAAIPTDVRILVDDIANNVLPYVYEAPKKEDEPNNAEQDDDAAQDGEQVGEEQANDETVEADGADEEPDEVEPEPERYVDSFTYMRKIASAYEEDDSDDGAIDDEEYSDDLYDPLQTPRFWKRYLMGKNATEGEDELSSEENRQDGVDDDETDGDSTMEGETPNAQLSKMIIVSPLKPNAPPSDDDEEADETESMEDENEAEEDDFASDLQNDDSDSNVLGPQDESDDALDHSEPHNDTSDDSKQDDAKKKKRQEREEKRRLKKEKKQDKKKRKGDGKDDGNGDEGQGTGADKSKDNKKEKRQPKPKNEGEKKVPIDEAEKTNPKLRLYNEILRHAYNFSEEAIDRSALSDEEVHMIYNYACDDYPQIFWTNGYKYSSQTMSLDYRCRTPNGKIDIKQIRQKTKAIQKHAKFFTRGITKKTNPYEALLTIYRRVILTFDYDGNGLDSHLDKNEMRDDALRSLYSAIVEHKVVCAGYAVAMQYLLQSVGISCACVTSEDAPNGGCHAFNALKIGKYPYYLDATWGDRSNTKTGKRNADLIFYNYCCVPYSDFIKTSPEERWFHTPRRKFYPNLEEFKAKNHEYYRFRNAFVTRFDKAQIAEIFANAARDYKEKEMGRFVVSFRCFNGDLAKYIEQMLMKNGELQAILKKAKSIAQGYGKNAVKLLEREFEYGLPDYDSGVLYFCFKTPPTKAELKKQQQKTKKQ